MKTSLLFLGLLLSTSAHASSPESCVIEFKTLNLCGAHMQYASTARGVTERHLQMRFWDRDEGTASDGPFIDLPGELTVKLTYQNTRIETRQPVQVYADVPSDLSGQERAVGFYRATPLQMHLLGSWKATFLVRDRSGRIVDEAVTYLQQARRERYE